MGHQRFVGDYILTQQIGAGAFAVVWKAEHRLNGNIVAIKEIATDKLNKKLQENLMSEIDILMKTNHPNIIRLYDIVRASHDRISLILEYCAGGDLSAYIQQRGRVPEDVARHFMRQLGAGLQVLRANNLIHRDLKPQNLLLSSNDGSAVLKIADFGFARSLQPQGMAETLCGSPLYMAPEILQSKRYDAKADLWSVGAILYQLVTGQPPFVGQNPVQLLRNIEKSNELHFPASILAELHPECLDLCRRLLCKDPVQRLSFEEFFNHSFIAQPIRSDKGPWNKSVVAEGVSSSPERGQGSFQASSSKGALMESSECLEGGYVLVNAPLASTETISLSASDQSMWVGHQSPCKNPQKSCSVNVPVRKPSGVVPLGLVGSTERPCTPSETSQGSIESADVADMSLIHSPRLQSLRNCAQAIAELAKFKLQVGQHLEAFLVQLVCLAVWKEALNVCHKWANASSGCGSHFRDEIGSIDAFEDTQSSRGALPFFETFDEEGGAVAACSLVDQQFLSAVEHAERLAPHLHLLDGNAEIPDAMEIIFQSALNTGRNAALDELLGRMDHAVEDYSKAATFLHFLLIEATSLPLTPHFVLSSSDRRRLHQYIEILIIRRGQCASQSESSAEPGTMI